jgi:hypothetical protein
VTIAITFGSVVLGLPTTLAESGFQPFLITIFASYIVQVNEFILFLLYTSIINHRFLKVLTLFVYTEVLQKAYYRNVEKLQEVS